MKSFLPSSAAFLYRSRYLRGLSIERRDARWCCMVELLTWDRTVSDRKNNQKSLDSANLPHKVHMNAVLQSSTASEQPAFRQAVPCTCALVPQGHLRDVAMNTPRRVRISEKGNISRKAARLEGKAGSFRVRSEWEVGEQHSGI